MPSKGGVFFTSTDLREVCKHIDVIVGQTRGIADEMDRKGIKSLEIRADSSRAAALERFEAWRAAAYKALTEWLMANTGAEKKVRPKASKKRRD